MDPRIAGAVSMVMTLGALATAHADLVLQRQVESEVLLVPKRVGGAEGEGECAVRVEQPPSGSLVTFFVGPDRARRDQDGLTVILREDRKRLFFIYPDHRKYSVIEYPVDPKRHEGDFVKMVGAALVDYRLEGERQGPEDVLVGGHKARRYSAKVVNKLRQNFRVTYALASDPALQAPALLRLQSALHEIEFGGHGFLHLLELEPGLPLQWDEWQVLPSSEVPFRQQAIEVRVRDVPPDQYDPPPGFEKIDFDDSCVSLR